MESIAFVNNILKIICCIIKPIICTLIFIKTTFDVIPVLCLVILICKHLFGETKLKGNKKKKRLIEKAPKRNGKTAFE